MLIVYNILSFSCFSYLLVFPYSPTIIFHLCLNTFFLLVVVENLELARAPIPNKEAIYLITPTMDSIEAVIEDFECQRKPQYAAAHLFFTTPLGDALFEKLTQSRARSYISSLLELNLMVYSKESQVFHTENHDILRLLYSPLPSKQEVSKLLMEVAGNVATLFTVLGEYPLIRYCKRSALSKKFSNFLKEKIEFFIESGAKITEKSSLPVDERCTILVVDRSFDMLAPLLHELSYQAMVNDLLSVDENNRIDHTFIDNSGQQQTKKVVLSDETDQLWVRLRHMHIVETSKWVVKNFNDYISANKKAEKLEVGNISTLKDMNQAILSMPQYQETKSKYAVHIELVNQCINIFKQKSLRKLIFIEQDMAYGAKKRGLKKELSELFNTEDYTKLDKLRLFLIYLISQSQQGRLTLRDKEEVAIDAGYPPKYQEDAKILQCLQTMGVKLSKDSLEFGAAEAKDLEKEKKKGKKKSMDQMDDLSRYTPKAKIILESLLTNNLPISTFPYLKSPPVDQIVQQKSAFKAKWGKKEKDGGGNYMKGRIILFILGGASYSEVRTVYELTGEFNREIVLGRLFIAFNFFFLSFLLLVTGTTSIYNPEQFVKKVKKIL